MESYVVGWQLLLGPVSVSVSVSGFGFWEAGKKRDVIDLSGMLER